MRKLNNKELQRITIEEFKKVKKNPITIVLDNVRSGFNVGSIFRTADAFLIEKIILCGITATPPKKEIRKVALGATNSVNWEFQKDTTIALKELKNKGYHILGIEQTTQSSKLEDLILSKKPIAIVLGNEVDGVSDDVIKLCDEIIEIRQFGTKHSLNISVTNGIIIWEIWKKLTF